MAAPVDAFAPRVGSDAAARVHDVKLPALAAGIRRDQGVDDVAGLTALAQQPYTVDAVIGIDQRLRRDAAKARGDMRHPRADREEAGRHRNSELAGSTIAGDDRPGHLSPFCLSMLFSENRFPLFRIMLYRPAA